MWKNKKNQETMNKLWHYTKDNDYPEVFGEYVKLNYPQIPCLVLYRGMFGVRHWNVQCKCWDDESCDDFFCLKDQVDKWCYIDELDNDYMGDADIGIDAIMGW